MAKHTQIIRRQIVDEFFECVWPFCEIGAYRVKLYIAYDNQSYSNRYEIFRKDEVLEKLSPQEKF